MGKIIYTAIAVIDSNSGIYTFVDLEEQFHSLSKAMNNGKKIVRYGSFRIANARLYFVDVS